MSRATMLSEDDIERDGDAAVGAGEGGDASTAARWRRRPHRRGRGAVAQSLQDYSINWITSLLSFIGRGAGRGRGRGALRKTGEEFVRPRRDTGTGWEEPPGRRPGQGDRPGHGRQLGRPARSSEDDEKIVLAFRCGTGGRLIDEGALRRRRRVPDAARAGPPDVRAGRAARLLRPLLGQQRDPARRVGRHPDEHRVPVGAPRRALRAPRLQGRRTDPRRGLRAPLGRRPPSSG